MEKIDGQADMVEDLKLQDVLRNNNDLENTRYWYWGRFFAEEISRVSPNDWNDAFPLDRVDLNRLNSVASRLGINAWDLWELIVFYNYRLSPIEESIEENWLDKRINLTMLRQDLFINKTIENKILNTIMDGNYEVFYTGIEKKKDEFYGDYDAFTNALYYECDCIEFYENWHITTLRKDIIMSSLNICESDLKAMLDRFTLEYIEASIEDNLSDGAVNLIGLERDGLIKIIRGGGCNG